MSRLHLRARQRGAAMPIYILAIFPLVAAFYVIHGVGWKVTNRARVQNVADQAAFTAAAVTADALNRVEFLNSALVTVKAMKSITRGIKYAYGPLTAYDAVLCFFGSAHHCDLFGRMVGNASSIFGGISNNSERLDDLHDLIATTAERVIRDTALDARDAAQRHASQAGVDRAVVITYDDRDALPLIDDPEGYGMRPLAMAGVFYGLHVLPQELKQFGSPDHALGFFGATAYFAVQGSLRGFKGPKYEDADAQRTALAVTAIVARESDDRDILGRMAAGGVRPGGGLGGLRGADVAVARAEPYYTLNDGESDGRPAWRARLRPLRLPFETEGDRGGAEENHIETVLSTRLFGDQPGVFGPAGQIFTRLQPERSMLVQ